MLQAGLESAFPFADELLKCQLLRDVPRSPRGRALGVLQTEGLGKRTDHSDCPGSRPILCWLVGWDIFDRNSKITLLFALPPQNACRYPVLP